MATDGSALGNPGPGGWAWAVNPPNAAAPSVWASGSFAHTTNNIAELTALREALMSIPAGLPLLVRTDSTYVRDVCTKWRFGWRRKGWKTASGAPVKNQELIKELDALLEGRDVTFQWVKAHVAGGGDPLNEFVDAAAQAAARSVRSGRGHDAGPGWPA